MSKKSIAVVGVGTAGLQALCHLCTWFDNNWKIISIYDPSIPPLKIGESTNSPFVDALFLGTGFNAHDHLKEIQATFKIGTLFKNWRTHDFMAPIWGGSFALHIDSFKMKDFVLPRLKEQWKSKIEFVEKRIDNLKNLPYDYIVDCRGFPKNYSDYIQPEEMLLNHALIHNIKKPGKWNYTGHRATRNGWMFEIPLQKRQSYGYMYCDKITSTREAKKDFAKEIKVPIDQLDNIEHSFSSYYAKKVFDGRIFKNGNRAVFFEPLSANSLFVYDHINKLIIERLQLKCIDDQTANNRFKIKLEAIRDLIYYYYHGGSIYKTKFWDKASRLASKGLSKSKGFREFKTNYYHYETLGTPYVTPAWGINSSILKIIDKQMGYNYLLYNTDKR